MGHVLSVEQYLADSVTENSELPQEVFRPNADPEHNALDDALRVFRMGVG